MLTLDESVRRERARSKVSHARRIGTLPALSQTRCAHCDRPARVHHHTDYSQPLTVVPLCDLCHRREHVQLNAQRRAAEQADDQEAREREEARRNNYERLFRPREACDRLGIEWSVLRECLERGDIKGYRVLTLGWRIPEDEVERVLRGDGNGD